MLPFVYSPANSETVETKSYSNLQDRQGYIITVNAPVSKAIHIYLEKTIKSQGFRVGLLRLDVVPCEKP